jgi:hypothetical protein
VKEQAHPAQVVAAGLAALPGVATAWASTQAAWRFFNNPAVTPPKLAEPLRAAVRRELENGTSPYVLVALDWSKLDYRGHASKTDRRAFCNPGEAGYALTSALAVDAATGDPLGPLEVELEASPGVLSTRAEGRQEAAHYLEQVGPIMAASAGWGLPRRPVFVMDAEFDSLEHYRRWHGDGRLFLVRADRGRRVKFGDESVLSGAAVEALRAGGAFREARRVEYHGRECAQFVAEAAVVLDRPAFKHKADGTKGRVPGPPLPLRLVAAEVRGEGGEVLALWLLLSDVPADVPAAELALWYYWRWRIESFFKLLKSAGVGLEEWRQETAEALLRRLLVACMACATAWRLERRTDAPSGRCKEFLVRLSGRQMKRAKPVTAPALLAGLHVLLAIEDALACYSRAEIRQLAAPMLAYLEPP